MGVEERRERLLARLQELSKAVESGDVDELSVDMLLDSGSLFISEFVVYCYDILGQVPEYFGSYSFFIEAGRAGFAKTRFEVEYPSVVEVDADQGYALLESYLERMAELCPYSKSELRRDVDRLSRPKQT